MHSSWIALVVSTLSLVTAGATAGADSADILRHYQAEYKASTLNRLHSSCGETNIAVRRSWYVDQLYGCLALRDCVLTCMYRDNLNETERAQYIDAVKCLRAKPAITPQSVAAGALNRMDDFTVQHVNQTLFIHFSVSLSPGYPSPAI